MTEDALLKIISVTNYPAGFIQTDDGRICYMWYFCKNLKYCEILIGINYDNNAQA